MHNIADARERSGMTVRVGYSLGEALPRDNSLVEVECQSLSRSGFTYWMISKPQNTGVLVVFGEPPNEVRVRARVVGCKVAEHNGRLRTLVSCQFIRRV